MSATDVFPHTLTQLQESKLKKIVPVIHKSVLLDTCNIERAILLGK